MKSLHYIIFLLILLSAGCESKTNSVGDIARVDSISNSEKSDFIEIPFSKLKRLAESDSITFLKEVASLGLKSNDNFIFAKEDVLKQYKDTIGTIGIGRYFFHEIPVLVKPTFDSKSIYYSFPVQYLSTYKHSMLQNSGRFFKIGEQKAEYHDVYKAPYIQETYVDLIAKMEFEYMIYKNYAMLIIRERDYF